MHRDKKVSGGTVRFILPDRIGAVRIHDDVGRDEMAAAVEFTLAFARGNG